LIEQLYIRFIYSGHQYIVCVKHSFILIEFNCPRWDQFLIQWWAL